jgi:hypothetical protein
VRYIKIRLTRGDTTMGLLTIVEQNKARACDRLPGDIRARALISQDVRTLDTIYRLRKAAASR